MATNYKDIAAKSGLGFSAAEVDKFIEAFQKFDSDGNGHIDEAELSKVMVEVGEKSSPQLVKEAIREVDLNQNGTVEFDEFLQVVSQLRSGTGKKTVFASTVSKKADLFTQKIDSQTKIDYQEGQMKSTWKTSGHSGGFSNEGKYKAATVKTPTTFEKPPPPKKSVSDLP